MQSLLSMGVRCAEVSLGFEWVSDYPESLSEMLSLKNKTKHNTNHAAWVQCGARVKSNLSVFKDFLLKWFFFFLNPKRYLWRLFTYKARGTGLPSEWGIWDQSHMRKWRKSHTQHHFTLLKNFSVLALSFQNAAITCVFKMHYEY